MPGSTLGTVAYMSPEQARGEEADERSDIWALGVVLYEMLTGQVPFKGTYSEAIFYAIKHEEPPPLSTAGRDIPEDIDRVVRRALTKDPAGRYQSARELARVLRQLQGRSVPLDLRTEPLPLVQGRGLQAGRKGSRRAAIMWGATAAGVLAAAAAGIYVWLARPIERTPIAIVPIANHTGEPELDGYRLALTQGLMAELSDSPNLRVISYARTLEVLRRFVDGGGDVSSLESIQTLSSQSGASVGGSVADTRAARGRPRRSPRCRDTNECQLSTQRPSRRPCPRRQCSGWSIAGIEDSRSIRRPLAASRRRQVGRGRCNLDAARAFEEAVNAYEQIGMPRRPPFRRTLQGDPQRSLSKSWLSRTLP